MSGVGIEVQSSCLSIYMSARRAAVIACLRVRLLNGGKEGIYNSLVLL